MNLFFFPLGQMNFNYLN